MPITPILDLELDASSIALADVDAAAGDALMLPGCPDTMLGILPFIGDDNEAKAIVTRLLATGGQNHRTSPTSGTWTSSVPSAASELTG